MSVDAVKAAVKARGLKPSEKLLLMALANYADPKGLCWPSHKTLSEDTGLSQRTILSGFKALEAAGHIVRTERKRPDGSRRTDAITVSIGGEAIAPRGEMVAPRGETISGGGEAIAPLTTFEPPLEPKIEAKASTVRSKDDPWLKDADFLEAWKACTQIGRTRSSQTDAWAQWKRLRGRVTGAELVQAMKRFVANDPDCKRTGGPAFHRWLRDCRWEHWLGPATPALSVVVIYDGPAELRNEVAAEMGEDHTRIYFDQSDWRETPPSLCPRSATAYDALRRSVGKVLAKRGVTLIEPKRSAA